MCAKKIEMGYKNMLLDAVLDFEAQAVTWTSILPKYELKSHANLREQCPTNLLVFYRREIGGCPNKTCLRPSIVFMSAQHGCSA